MLFLNALFLALFWVMQSALCLPGTTVPHHTSPYNGAPANLTWEGHLTENGPTVSFTGESLADIGAQIAKVAPDFVFPEPLVLVQQSRSPRRLLPRARAHPLEKNSEHRMLCDQVVSGYADFYHVLDQAAQLQAMPGFCRVSPTPDGAPLSCNRLTCAEGSAVFLCNHSNNHDSISTCERVGQYAQEIIEWCYDGASTTDVKGQIYDGDYWSVMVHADTC
ncbi:hypothetical protein F5Y10DRAFT_256305 [Nemania abortiva]|nr:hypothetical protein F5Y10DRAFT_256305 [Nemania abortiva]